MELSADQHARLTGNVNRRSSRRHVGVILRTRARQRVEVLRSAGRREAMKYLNDAFWIAGVVAYWAEGSKRSNELSLSNSDPATIRLFVRWARTYLAVDEARFGVRLHIHDGQDEDDRKAFWCDETGLPMASFRKTFIKPEGTGHRKNVLYNGTALVRVSCSVDLLHRVLGWIDAVADQYATLGYTPLGR
jgi:hypothetical protein